MGTISGTGISQKDQVQFYTNVMTAVNELMDSNESSRLLIDELRTELAATKVDLEGVQAGVTSLAALSLTITTIEATAPTTLAASQLSLTV